MENVSLVSLGHGVARIVILKQETDREQCALEFMAPGYSGGGYYPAASFRIFGRVQIEKLRDALNEALTPKQEG